MRLTSRPARTIAVAAALVLGASACTADTGTDSDIGKGGVTEPTTIEFWHFFADREAKVIEEVVKDFEKKNDKITVTIKSGQDDEKMKQAIAAGQPVDVGLSYSTDIVGTFCSKDAWRDLGPYIDRDKVKLDQFPEVVRGYTAYKGVQCSMPMLADVYGLYYNKDLLKAGGYTEPPKTMTELAAMGDKLTKLDAKGNIVQAGFVPLMPFYENVASHLGPSWGAEWFDKDGKPTLSTDPGWAEMLTWQKALLDKHGVDKWKKFAAGAGDEFSADNAFMRGKVALNIDGEYRQAFIKADTPQLNYGTAVMPVGGRQERPVRLRLRHRQHHGYRPRLEEPGSCLAAHQVPEHRHRRDRQALRRPPEHSHDGSRAEEVVAQGRRTVQALHRGLREPEELLDPGDAERRRAAEHLRDVHRQLAVGQGPGSPEGS